MLRGIHGTPHPRARARLAAFAADLVLIAHLLIALFAVFGGFAILLEPGVALAHLPVVAWSSIVNLAHWTCPLTPLEQWLRRHAGQSSFEGGWIQHYLDPVVRPLGMPRRLEMVAGISIVVWNVAVYGVIMAMGSIT